MIALRESPDLPGPSCILKCTLVAKTMSSRRAYFLKARPTISSELPIPYTLAVSQKLMPRSTACWKNGWASSSLMDHALNPRDVSPKLMQPSAIRLTWRPELPRRLFSMIDSFRQEYALSLSKGTPHFDKLRAHFGARALQPPLAASPPPHGPLPRRSRRTVRGLPPSWQGDSGRLPMANRVRRRTPPAIVRDRPEDPSP